MNTTYNPQEPSTLLINEIKYYMAFSALKKLFLKGLITKENCEKANVAIAEKYGVSVGYCSAIAVQAGISNKELSHRRITRRQQKRNDEIFEKYQNGIEAKDLAKAYHYSLPGIYSIIRRVRKQKCKRD